MKRKLIFFLTYHAYFLTTGLNGQFDHDCRNQSAISLAFILGVYVQACIIFILQLVGRMDLVIGYYLVIASFSYAISISAAIMIYRDYTNLMCDVVIPSSYTWKDHLKLFSFMAGGILFFVFSIIPWSNFV